MNLKKLSDSCLLEQTDRLVRNERKLLAEILHHLREIERRRLFAQLGFKSLFEYAVKRLGYADDQAGRRIAAMRLLKELPELEEKIADGSLTLTNIGMAQTLFRQEVKREDSGFTRQEKLELLKKLENRSKREAEGIIASQAGGVFRKPDQIRAVGNELIEYRFQAEQNLQAKLEKIKGLLAHSHPNMSMEQILNMMADITIEQLDPGRKNKSSQKRKKSPPALSTEVSSHSSSSSSALALKRCITAETKRYVWQKAQSRCENCASQFALQIDHHIPLALGGTNEKENLRLLCRNCNHRAAINKLGLTKMQRFLDRPPGG